ARAARAQNDGAVRRGGGGEPAGGARLRAQELTMTELEALQKRLAPLFPGLMGVKLVEVSPDRVVATMAVRPELCTSGGILHGGAYMAFADTLGAVGTVIDLPPGARTPTTDSSTNLIGRAPVGSTVTGEQTAF